MVFKYEQKKVACGLLSILWDRYSVNLRPESFILQTSVVVPKGTIGYGVRGRTRSHAPNEPLPVLQMRLLNGDIWRKVGDNIITTHYS